MFKTRITELLGIKHPIMQAGMNWLITPEMVAAACNAGGLGILATAHWTPEETRKSIKKIRELTSSPFGVNVALMVPGAVESVQVAIEEKVPVINYSLGRPWFIEQVHEYGGKVIATVAMERHAVRAEQFGCDALSVTGFEGAGHTVATTSLVFIPLVAKQVGIPLIAAGGFYNGRGLAAALALGADAISMGTRFMVTKESALHDNFKQFCINASAEDTLYSNVFDGMDGRVLKTKAAEALMKGGFPLLKAVDGALEVKRALKLSFWQFVRLSFSMMRAEEGEEARTLLVQARQAACTTRILKAVNDGDLEEGVLFGGQSVGGIEDVPSSAELIERIVAEAEEVLEAMVAKQVKP